MTDQELKVCTEFLEEHPDFFRGLLVLNANEKIKGMIIGGISGVVGTLLGVITGEYIKDRKNKKNSGK